MADAPVADAEMAEGGVAAVVEATEPAKPEPVVKLGYTEFPTARAAKDFFKNLLVDWPRNVDVNEYEHMALLDLVKHHPDHERKFGVGVRAFQVRPFTSKSDMSAKEQEDSRAYHVVRKDGTAEDFSYIKCLAGVFPGQITPGNGRESSGQSHRHGHGHGHGHRGRGGSGRGGGRGGRSGGRGRGSPRGGGRGRGRH